MVKLVSCQFQSNFTASLPAELLLMISAEQNRRSDSRRCRKSAASCPCLDSSCAERAIVLGSFFYYFILRLSRCWQMNADVSDHAHTSAHGHVCVGVQLEVVCCQTCRQANCFHIHHTHTHWSWQTTRTHAQAAEEKKKMLMINQYFKGNLLV